MDGEKDRDFFATGLQGGIIAAEGLRELLVLLVNKKTITEEEAEAVWNKGMAENDRLRNTD